MLVPKSTTTQAPPYCSYAADAGHALVLYGGQCALECLAVGWIQLQQRLEDEPAMPQLAVRHLVAGRVDRRVGEHQDVDVERTRRVPRRVQVAAQLDLDAL